MRELSQHGDPIESEVRRAADAINWHPSDTLLGLAVQLVKHLRGTRTAAVRELDAAYREHIDRLLHGWDASRSGLRVLDARRELGATLDKPYRCEYCDGPSDLPQVCARCGEAG